MRWRASLKDRHALLRIDARLERMAGGNFGDVKRLRDGISELRIDYGPGYRVYFMRRGPLLIVLLAGGDKCTQVADIDLAVALAKDWKE
ncbi:MAG: type II toxin-antitoxin system RelE/ParE family toxin [Rhodocyclaceae bacterium]|nr:type II toxin-antitoxin system RelE/ParE family toxin [Rhodocyclaceae bacterium]MBX3668388.1 type II toxin-antitoxin system RelE/ParE family toxin [Rhodocyclaceae bacterium]